MKTNKPILYIKQGCPWCQEALNFFNNNGVELDVRDVNRSSSDMNAMVAISGQTLTPTFSLDGFVVADFSVDEFLAELNEVPDVRDALGLTNLDD